MYMKAFVDFADGGGSVKEIHLIDVNRDILDLVIAAHKEWVTNPSALDFKNALAYPSVASYGKTRRGRDACQVATQYNEDIITFDGEGTTAYQARYCKYTIYKKLTVYVYSGSLTRLDTVDAIALTIPPGLQGGLLADAVRRAAGANYKQEIQRYKSSWNGKIFVCQETGKMACKHIVHLVLDTTSQNTSVADVYRRLLTHDYTHNIQYLGMPLFGTSKISSTLDLQTISNYLISTLVDVCCDRSKTMQITELHIVNLNPTITTTLKAEFNKWTNTPGYRTTNYDQTTYSKSKMGSPVEAHVATQHGSNMVSSAHGWTLSTPLQDNKGSTTGVLGHTIVAKQISVKPPTNEKAPRDSKCVYCMKKAEVKLECNHMYCAACAVPMKNKACLKCSKISDSTAAKPSNVDKDCPICLETMKKPKKLPCNHQLCTNCYESVKKHKPQCPICQHIFGKLTGNQPNGEMYYRQAPWLQLPGYERFGAIEICYTIPPGKQEKCHPNPGKPYTGIERMAYLPNNDEGTEVLLLLRMAFDRKLVFTVGESRTTGKEGVVTWNDIHHKTNPHGGPEKFGYPDPTYLVRVKEELATKGVIL